MKGTAGLRATIVPAMMCVLYLSAGLAGVPSAAVAAEEALPKGEDVCDRYVEVCGGRAAFDKLDNRKLKAVFEIPAQGLVLDMTVYAARPNLFRSVLESPLLGRIEKGISRDEVVWEVSTMAGPSVKEGMERTATLRDSRLDRLVDWRRAYPSAECTGTGTVGGKECWMVEMKPEEGNPLTFYYEKDSGFLVKISTVMQSAMGDVPVDTYLVEHREIDGVLLPWKIVVESMGSERTITNQSVEHNVDIPEGTFDIPEEISALLE